SDVVWSPVSFTHVEYAKGDFFGKILAWMSLLPVFILSGFATHIYFRREIHTVSLNKVFNFLSLWYYLILIKNASSYVLPYFIRVIVFFVGIFVNESVNFIIKHIVQEARPIAGHTVLNVEHGWPSSHSQFVWFFISYVILFIYIRSHNNNGIMDMLWKHGMCGLCVVTGCMVSYSRVYLLYHFFNQVLWGFIFGTILGVSWFAITQLLLSPWFPFIVSWKVCEFFMIRDSTLIPNIMWFEYTTSRQESRSRSRKMSSNKLQ
uniref:Dolichyldiphosphatase n=1 Tax=Ciona savignyi TaxID=51511 RepID=H2Z4M7_CIOSA